MGPVDQYLERKHDAEPSLVRSEPPQKLSYEMKYQAKMASLPRTHPAHPYVVYLTAKDEKPETRYVSASSPERAKIAGMYWSNCFRKRKAKFTSVRAIARVPVESSMYWDHYNLGANPDHLMLSDYLDTL